MRYIDGFLLTLPKKNIRAYTAIAKKAAKIWREHGALEYRECLAEDMASPCGVPFPKVAKATAGETVVFAWILYKSRAHRDKVNKAVMADPRMLKMMNGPMPFDMQRMSHGGFQILVDS